MHDLLSLLLLLLLGDSVQDNQNRLLAASNDLHCFSRLVVQIVGLKFGMTFADRKLLESSFCVGFVDSLDQVIDRSIIVVIVVVAVCLGASAVGC